MHKKLWREKIIQSENVSSYMIFLACKFVRYIKTSMLLQSSILYYDIIWGNKKEQKNKNISHKETKFPFCVMFLDFWSDIWWSRYHNSKIHHWVVSKCTVLDTQWPWSFYTGFWNLLFAINFEYGHCAYLYFNAVHFSYGVILYDPMQRNRVANQSQRRKY